MRRRRGVTMVMSLAMLAALVAIVSVVAVSQRLTFLAEENRMDQRRAYVAALAGVQRAMAELSTVDVNLVTAQDQWATLTQSGDQKFSVADTSFRFQIVDASALINLNTATQAQLQNLNLTSEQIDSLLDWRSAELQPRLEGAKDEYYNGLYTPYNVKLRNFDTVDELLLVKAFTPVDLYDPPNQNGVVTINTTGAATQRPLIDLLTVDSVSPNTTADGTTRLNANTAQLNAIVQRGIPVNVATAIVTQRGSGTYTNLGSLLRLPGVTTANCQGILDNLAVSGGTQLNGKINLNTATEDVLNTVPGMTPDVVSAILTRQQSGFATLGELATLPGVTMNMLQQAADMLAVGSQVFLVRCVGTAGRTSVAVEAAVRINNNQPVLLRVSRCPFADMPGRWSWVTDVSNETILVENQ